MVRKAAGLRESGEAEGGLLGLFADGHLPYELDRLNSPGLKKDVPSLREMAEVALERLARNPDGFLLQIEAARVDHAAHANDVGGLLYDQIAFDEAVGAVVAFAEEHPDTLVLVTTDHGNANPGLSSGNDGGERNFSVLDKFRGTHGSILAELDAESSTNDIRRSIRKITELDISADNAALLQKRLRETFHPPYHRMDSVDAVLGQILANHTDIGWVGNTHTSDNVELSAFGPGSGKIRPLQKNTDLFRHIATGLGLDAAAAASVRGAV